MAQTPITAVMLLEFAANTYYFINDMRTQPSASSARCGLTTTSPS